MKTRITVYLQGTSKEYLVDESRDEVVGHWETSHGYVALVNDVLVYINRNNCPIVEFEDVPTCGDCDHGRTPEGTDLLICSQRDRDGVRTDSKACNLFVPRGKSVGGAG